MNAESFAQGLGNWTDDAQLAQQLLTLWLQPQVEGARS